MNKATLLLALLFTSNEALALSTDIASALSNEHWISFAPTGYYPGQSPPVIPAEDSITADLAVLKRAGFTGLVTYSANLPAVYNIAEILGFRALLVGIWNPFDENEVKAAVRVAQLHRGIVTGVVVGNEGLLNGRYLVGDLCKVMARIRSVSDLPVTSTEPVDIVLNEPLLASCSDFITANAHPFFSEHRKPDDAVKWTVEAWKAIRAQYPQKPLFVKETGLPTAESIGMSEKDQADFYSQLAQTAVVFSYFEAFDGTTGFKDGPIEQSWGLWRSNRTPKAIVKILQFNPDQQ